jgi:hypothetical protein
MQYYIYLFRNSSKKGKWHIQTTPSVECINATDISFKQYLKYPVLVDIEETIASNYLFLYTQYLNEDISWNYYDDICGNCTKTLLKNMKLGLWPHIGKD